MAKTFDRQIVNGETYEVMDTAARAAVSAEATAREAAVAAETAAREAAVAAETAARETADNNAKDELIVSSQMITYAQPSVANKYIRGDNGVIVDIPSYPGFAISDVLPVGDDWDAVFISKATYTNDSIYVAAFYSGTPGADTFISGLHCSTSDQYMAVPNNAKYLVWGTCVNQSGIGEEPDIRAVVKSTLKQKTKQDNVIIQNPSFTVEGSFVNPQGQIIEIPSYPGFKRTGVLKVPDGAIAISLNNGYSINNPSVLMVAFFGSYDGSNFISGVAESGENSSFLYPVPIGANYVIFSSVTDSSGNYYNYASPFVWHTVKGYSETRNSAWLGRKVRRISTGSFTEEKIISTADGREYTVSGYPGFKVSDFIPLNDDDTYIIMNATNIIQNASIYLVAFYRTASDSSFISGVPLGEQVRVAIPSGAKYIRFGSNTNSIGMYTQLDSDFFAVIDDVRNQLLENGGGGSSVKLAVPSRYDLIVGDTFELFYKGIINSWDDEGFLVQANCSIGSNYKKRFVATPTAAGNTELTLRLIDPANNVKDEKTVTLVARSAPSNPASEKTVLCVGDSLTYPGTWVVEMARRLTGSGGSPAGYGLSNLSFIGTCEKDGVNYEGYGGWTFQSYNTANVLDSVKWITCSHDKTEGEDQHSVYQDSAGGQWKIESVETGRIKIILTRGSASSFPATGTLTWVSGGTNHSNIVYSASENAPGNPFWDNTQNKVDFGVYANRIGASGIDYVYVLLGWNSAGSTKASYKEQAQTFINNVKASYPNAKIVLMGLQIPARDGLGLNYGASGTWSKYIGLMDYVHDLDDWYDELVDENTNVYHINISGQFDTEHNMPQSTRTVNTRNSETEVYQTNGVHPADSGYYQIADAATRSLVGLLTN